MPLLKDDDRQTLVENEEPPDKKNMDATAGAGRFAAYDDDDDDNEHINGSRFSPATLPDPEVQLHRHSRSAGVGLQQRAQIIYTDSPPDRYNFTYIVFYLLGTATMTPWNFFITAEDYWMYKFRNTTWNGTDPALEPELTPMQKSFTCDLTLTASISGTTFLILNAIYGQRISLKVKMYGTLTMILVMFAVTTIFVELNTDRWQEQFFLITLLTVVIINISSAVMSGAAFGMVGLFPSEYMTALVSGQALGGIFTALAFILVLAFGVAPSTTAFSYFIIGIILIALSIVLYTIMTRQRFFCYYLDGGDKYRILCETPSHTRVIDDGVALEPNVRDVFAKIYVEAASIALLFCTTLSVYPAVSVLMQSQNYGSGNLWSDVYYLPVVNYLFFNSGDYFGRILAGLWERPRKNAHTVLLMTLLRILFVPFFLCSNSNVHNFLPVLVHSDVAFIIMMICFALSNGYLTNILLILAPKSVMHHEKEIASSIMVASLSCGLALGSLLSMGFVQLL